MVIVIMGDVKSDPNCVGGLLAEYLGWDFADVESLRRDVVSRNSLSNLDCTTSVKSLYAAIDSLTYEWRDVIVSCPILKDQSFHNRHPLVKFVYLKATDETDGHLRLDKGPDITDSGPPMKPDAGLNPDTRILTVYSSQKLEQILTTVLSELILK